MRDVNILSYVGSSLWAITAEKWAEVMPALIRHVNGEKLTDEELQAFVSQRAASGPAASPGRNVAVIPVMGTIAHRMDALQESSGGTSTASINRMIDQATSDPSIGTIVYHFDTPGGTVVGLQETAAKMFGLRGGDVKQIAMVEGQCCSAGYWLASQCDEVVAVPQSSVGSIGVFSAHQDMSEALKQKGINVTLIKAGKFKVENNPFEPLSGRGPRADSEPRRSGLYAVCRRRRARARYQRQRRAQRLRRRPGTVGGGRLGDGHDRSRRHGQRHVVEVGRPFDRRHARGGRVAGRRSQPAAPPDQGRLVPHGTTAKVRP
jgi:hypothetical protein